MKKSFLLPLVVLVVTPIYCSGGSSQTPFSITSWLSDNNGSYNNGQNFPAGDSYINVSVNPNAGHYLNVCFTSDYGDMTNLYDFVATQTFSSPAPGVYGGTITCIDTMGNQASTTFSFSVAQGLSVSAGPVLSVTLPASALLQGTVSDVLPITSTSWTKLTYTGTGSGAVSFYRSNQPITLAQFSDPGTYVLQLTATDAQASASSQVIITVNPPAPVTGQPNQVSVQGAQLLVAKRQANGSLGLAAPYTIQGVTWSPSTQAPATGPDPITGNMVQYGFFFDDDPSNPWRSPGLEGHDLMNYWLKGDLLNHYQADIALMAQMGVNTVRVYSDFGDATASYQAILDAFYNKGIMVVMSVIGSKSDIDSGRYLQVVQMCKNHPAILMWSIGNEWNFNQLYGYPDMASAIAAVNQAAAQIKAIDPNHPVTSSLGDKFVLNPPGPCGPDVVNSDVPSVVNGVPNVDIWGMNVYRGASFGALFTQWKAVTRKPLYLSEFGTDSFATTQYTTPFYNAAACQFNSEAQVQAGNQDQATQASWDTGLWKEIWSNESAFNIHNDCAGGFVHTFNDQLWKVGDFNVGLGNLVSYATDTSYNAYNMDGFWVQGGHPDNVANEEYFGLVDANRNPKQAFQALRHYFVNQPPVVSAGPDQTITLPAQATLNGIITDDGLIQPIVSTWSVLSGTGNVIFSSTYTAATNASFSQPGIYGLQISVFDGQYTATSSMTLTVNLSTPVITSSTTATGTVGTAFSYQITATNTPTSFNAVGLPAGLFISTGTGVISGTPASVRASSVTLLATNAGGTGSATLALAINPSAPVITSTLTAIGIVGSTFTYQITATNSPTNFSATSLPLGISVSTATGLISGIPSSSGTFNATMTATNAGGTGSAALMIVVSTMAINPPTSVAFSTATATSLTLTWSASTGPVLAAGYRVDLSFSPAFTSFVSFYKNANTGNALFTFRPGRIKQVFSVDIAKPRDPDDPKLERLIREIVDGLHDEVEKALSEELKT